MARYDYKDSTSNEHINNINSHNTALATASGIAEGIYHCTADLLFDWFVFGTFEIINK